MRKRADPPGWVRLRLSEDIERIARERCAGYAAPLSKGIEEIMRDCYVQGVLDGGAAGEWLSERKEGSNAE